MENSQRVRVAVSIRPDEGTDCISVVHGGTLPQVQIGSKSFTFDYVYGGSTGSPASALYGDCVSPLVEALFDGRNATLIAYGQTGSGKTYTMGTDCSGKGSNVGVIPKVMEDIFQRVEVMKDSREFVIRVSFIEVLMDKVYDLLVQNSSSRVSLQIRETDGGTTVAEVIEAEVRTKEEMATQLSHGSQSRATGSTNMNKKSREMAPPRRNTGNGQSNAEGTTNLQAIIEAIGGLTNIVQHQVGATNPTCALEKFRKLDPPTFKGTKDPIEADNWLKEIERLFRAMEVSDGQRVILAVFVLKGDALEWWESTERTHGREVITWKHFIELFRRRYFPDSLMVQKEAEFIRIAQGTQSVYEYERKFAELSRFGPHMVDTEARKARHFERGLREEIQGPVSMFKLETYAEVVDRALIAERNCNRLSMTNDREREPNQSNFLKGKSSEISFKKQGVPNSNKKAHKTCPRCGKAHGGTCYLESRACFKCGKIGHFIKDCPDLKSEPRAEPNDINHRPKIQGRVFAITGQGVEESKSVAHMLSLQLLWSKRKLHAS